MGSVFSEKPCFLVWFCLPLSNSHDLIMFSEKQLILRIHQSYLDILCSVCKLSLKCYLLSPFTGKFSSICGVSLIYPELTVKCTFKLVHNDCDLWAKQLLPFSSAAVPVQWKDDWGWTALFGEFSSFFSCQWSLRGCTCPSQPSLWGLRGRNQGRRNNESSHCLQGIQTLPLSGGSSSLKTPTLWSSLETPPYQRGHALRWPLSRNPKAREGCDHTSAAFWVLGGRVQQRAEKLQKSQDEHWASVKSHCLNRSLSGRRVT